MFRPKIELLSEIRYYMLTACELIHNLIVVLSMGHLANSRAYRLSGSFNLKNPHSSTP